MPTTNDQMLQGPLEVVYEAGARLAESPVWDDRTNCLYWVDIEAGRVCCLDPASRKSRTVEIGQRVGAVALRQNGGLIAAMEQGIYYLDFDSGKTHWLADPESHLPDNRFNDAKCDPCGRLWAGTMGMNRPRQPVAALYMLAPGQPIKRQLDQVSVSNGMAWSADSRIFYYIDTQLERVDAFDFNRMTGSITNRRTVIRIAEGEGRPDGMTIDNEGMLWVAHWGGWQVGRYDPQTGEKLFSVELPVARVSSCAFGGPNLDWLYITTARDGLSEAEAKEQPLAGSIFRIKTNQKGRPADRYAG